MDAQGECQRKIVADTALFFLEFVGDKRIVS